MAEPAPVKPVPAMRRAYMDARCQCGRKIAWMGAVADRPKCPKCGHRPSAEELAKAQADMDAFFQRIEMPTRRKNGNELRKSREDAGLSIGQAAKLLGVTRECIEVYERGHVRVPDATAAKMDEVYCTGPKEPSGG